MVLYIVSMDFQDSEHETKGIKHIKHLVCKGQRRWKQVLILDTCGMIEGYEKALMRSALITTNFKNIKNHDHELKRKKFKTIIFPFFLCIYFFFRSSFVLIISRDILKQTPTQTPATSTPSSPIFMDANGTDITNLMDANFDVSTISLSVDAETDAEDMKRMRSKFILQHILGDYLYPLGISSLILHSWFWTYSVVGIVFRIVFLVSEHSNDSHKFFTDFHPENYSNLKLNEKNLKTLIFHTKVLLFLYKVRNISYFTTYTKRNIS